jgi:hypothetical protein
MVGVAIFASLFMGGGLMGTWGSETVLSRRNTESVLLRIPGSWVEIAREKDSWTCTLYVVRKLAAARPSSHQ